MTTLRQTQRGIVAVLLAVGLVALLAMLALALDTGHLLLNKSRLQSTVDAAALAAAKVLDTTGSEDQATAAARSVFDRNAAEHPELAKVLSGADINPEYSRTLNPFVPGTSPANYVRVRAENFSMWTAFAGVVGFKQLATHASAVAGPSAPIGPGEVCSLVPLMVCADMAAGDAGDWGYTSQRVTLLKLASGSTSAVGPGNFQLIQLGGPGADVVRHTLAGGFNECIDKHATVTTKPGNNAGPTAQGLNTRFGIYQGGGMNPTDYPPDKITTQPGPGLDVADDGNTVILKGGTPVTSIDQVSYNYASYQADKKAGNYTNPNGKLNRRILPVPIVDCTNMVHGQGTLPVVGVGCFFMLQEVSQSGSDAYVFGQFQERCEASGPPGPEPGNGGPGVYTIVLYRDYASPDS